MSITALHLKESTRTLRRKIAASVFCAIPLLWAGQAFADALWYALEEGSKLELANGTSSDLTGRIALMGCGGSRDGSKPAERNAYLFYAMKLDNTPEELQNQLNGNSRIGLFGGSGEEVSGKHGSMVIRQDGTLKNFQWWLRHKLEHDNGSEAETYRRNLIRDSKTESRISFRSDTEPCPEKMELHLRVNDSWSSFKPDLRTSSTGEQKTFPRPAGSRQETIGKLTLIASAIPGSEEKITENISERPFAAESVRPERQAPQKAPQAISVRRSGAGNRPTPTIKAYKTDDGKMIELK